MPRVSRDLRRRDPCRWRGLLLLPVVHVLVGEDEEEDTRTDVENNDDDASRGFG